MMWVVVGLWGGVVGLDVTSFSQCMISRPLVAASLTGLLLGHPVAGALLGLIFEAFALTILPIGAARYPEAGPATVAATAAYVEAAGSGVDGALLLLAVVLGLVWERVGGASVYLLRRVDERFATAAGTGVGGIDREVERRHLAAMVLDFVRAGTVAVVGGVVGAALLRVLGSWWALGESLPLAVLGVAGAAMLGAALSLFGGWAERRVAFAAGLLCGLALLLLR